jgi:uncharacterized protein (DUF2147 family)
MKKIIFRLMSFAIWIFASSAFAQMTPVGVWRTIDDSTGEPKSEVQIVDQGGVLTGKVIKSLSTNPNVKKICDECSDERKGQPILGMEIIRGVKAEPGEENLWAGGGKILDPNNGKEYTVRFVPLEGGAKLRVRGYIGPFYRTQIWIRVQ